MKTKKRWILTDDMIFLLRLSRICCLAPIRCSVNNNTTLTYISRPLQIISVFLATALQLLTIKEIYFNIATSNAENYKRSVVGAIGYAFTVAFTMYAVFTNETRIGTYMKCLAKMNKVQRNLHNYGMNVRNNSIIMLTITFIGVTCLLTVFDAFVCFKSLTFGICVLLLEITISNVLQLQFFYTALSINNALQIIKNGLQDELSKMVDDGKVLNNPLESINKAVDMIGNESYILQNINHTMRKKLSQRISLINDSYVVICDALREFNSSDDILMFLQLVAFTSHIVFTWYNVVLLHHDEYLVFVKYFIKFTWFVYQIIEIIIITESYHSVQEKNKKIRLLMAEMMCYITTESDPVFNEIKAFCKQLLFNNVSYSVLGICHLGRPLISVIIGVITTVTIIIIEF